jgi:hypothetical protein
VNKNGTSTDNAQLKDDVETKYPVRDAVLQVFDPFDLSTLYPSGMFFFYPLYDACPDIDGEMIIAENPGRYLYMVFNELGDVAHVLRLSIADEIFQLQTYNPGQALFLEDEVSGVAISLPASATVDAAPIAIGWGGDRLFSGSTQLAQGEQALFFDILPYGLALDEPATVSVPYKGSQAHVLRYDENNNAWAAVEDAKVSDGYVTFSTQVLGRFKVTDQAQAQGEGHISPIEDNRGSCFINSCQDPCTSIGVTILLAIVSAVCALVAVSFHLRPK